MVSLSLSFCRYWLEFPQSQDYFEDGPYKPGVNPDTGKEYPWWSVAVMDKSWRKERVVHAAVFWYSLKVVIKVHARQGAEIILPRWHSVTDHKGLW